MDQYQRTAWQWDPKAVNDVRSRASARKTGAGIWRRIYGADFIFWSVYQGPKTQLQGTGQTDRQTEGERETAHAEKQVREHSLINVSMR